MIVYGDILFIENMVIGGVLLYLTGDICGRSRQRVDKIRLLIGSIMCGAFSLVIFLHAKAPLMMLMEVCFALMVCTVVFSLKGQRHTKFPWRHAVIFILVTYFMGGMTMGLLLLTQNQGIYTAAGIYTGDMKAAALALFIALGYMTTKQIITTIKNKKLYEEHSFDVTICCGNKNIRTKGFLDTGNHLAEPISGRPAAVASEELWIRMQSCGIAPRLGADEMFGDDDEHSISIAMIPYETVGHKGLLEAVKADMIIGEKYLKGCYVARGDGGFNMRAGRLDGESEAGWELLLSAKMVDTDIC